MSHDAMDAYLRAVFESFGDISGIAVSDYNDNTSRNARFAHVEFDKRSACSAALGASDDDYVGVGAAVALSHGLGGRCAPKTGSALHAEYPMADLADLDELRETINAELQEFEEGEEVCDAVYCHLVSCRAMSCTFVSCIAARTPLTLLTTNTTTTITFFPLTIPDAAQRGHSTSARARRGRLRDGRPHQEEQAHGPPRSGQARQQARQGQHTSPWCQEEGAEGAYQLLSFPGVYACAPFTYALHSPTALLQPPPLSPCNA